MRNELSVTCNVKGGNEYEGKPQTVFNDSLLLKQLLYYWLICINNGTNFSTFAMFIFSGTFLDFKKKNISC